MLFSDFFYIFAIYNKANIVREDLFKQINELAKEIQADESIDLMYEGHVIAAYSSIDSRTPADWLRHSLCFGIQRKGRDINNKTIELKYKKNLKTLYHGE